MENINNPNKIDTSYNTPSNQVVGAVDNNKKLYILIASFVISFIILIIVIFYILNKKETITPIVDNTKNFPVIDYFDKNKQDYYQNSTSTSDEYIENEYSELVHVWPRAVSGYGISKKSNGTGPPLYTSVMFADLETGNIYESSSPDFKINKISNEIIPNILKSSFSYNNSVLAMQNNKFTLYTSALPSSNPDFLEKTLVSEGVLDFSFSKNENKLVYLKKEKNGSAVYYYDIEKNENTRIYSSPLSDFNIEWLNVNDVILKSKPSSITTETVIRISIKDLKFEPINSSNIINKLYPSYKNLAYNGSTIQYFDQINALNKITTKINSIPDKCVLIRINILCAESLIGSTAIMPDDWYKGNVTFTDYITIYNIARDTYTSYDLSLVAGEQIDLYKPQSLQEEILFINKRDLSLWLLDSYRLLSE